MVICTMTNYHHHHDDSLLSKHKNGASVRITKIGLYVNLGIAVSKCLGRCVFNSRALVADAIHSLTDRQQFFPGVAEVAGH
ncbi:Mitochondrial metal transporter 2 [Pyrenophora teres f. teres]|uniref:Mitochondrial metal transporter 2 n=1 Tax=Pyrenophora teres f. teres TaxID=97479 RepID=A0A6S6VRA8_9PLEO|nr:Mitochondrial metal transporter 2 [Pyrenophora teres f. teres]